MSFRLLPSYLVTFLFLVLFCSSCKKQEPVKQMEASLEAKTILPASTFVRLDKSIPPYFSISGRFVNNANVRNSSVASSRAKSFVSDKKNPRYTGISLPVKGQPLQGFSGIDKIGENLYIIISDNGFGSKRDSYDSLLMMHRVRFDWSSQKMVIEQSFVLNDELYILPFALYNEGSQKRLLTGADLDIESVQVVGNQVFLGDEFGPYLIRVDFRGTITGFWPAKYKGKIIRSPDNVMVQKPKLPRQISFEVQRSRGFEGLAYRPKSDMLYAVLESPLIKENEKQILALEFNIKTEKFTGRSLSYQLEKKGNSIGDINFYDSTRAAIIERDWGEGDVSRSCDKIKPPCFNRPARFKRVYFVDFPVQDKINVIQKVSYVDLLDIKISKQFSNARSGKYTFPYVTIENVEWVDLTHIIVGNDNNFALSSGRQFGKSDDSEFLLLKIVNK